MSEFWQGFIIGVFVVVILAAIHKMSIVEYEEPISYCAAKEYCNNHGYEGVQVYRFENSLSNVWCLRDGNPVHQYKHTTRNVIG